MGLFDKLFGKRPENNVSSTGTQSIQSLNLNKEQRITQLNLRKDKIQGLCLEKRELNGLTARVALVLDYSGSMSRLYQNGSVQEVVEKLLPVAMQFDDNGEMECWIFENGFHRLDDISLNNFDTYISNLMHKNYEMGGTYYAPVMKDVAKKYLKEDPSQYPTLVIFITDGDNFDGSATDKVICDLSKYNIFWQFIGIGNADFDYLEHLDEMEGRFIDNANFFALNDFRDISDDELYHRLLQEYPDWINKAKKAKIL